MTANVRDQDERPPAAESSSCAAVGASRDILRELQTWYVEQCDRDWEHQNGVSIQTLDNPGWSLRIDLAGTGLLDQPLDPIDVRLGEHGWLVLRRTETQFEAACGPGNLNEAIRVFLDWALPS